MTNDASTGVSPRVENALRTAMERLFSGRPERTDGRLIKDNLWKEAQVSRATMNRATSILGAWDEQIAVMGARTPGEARRDTEVAKLRADLKAARDDNKQLRERIDAAATVIATLYADNTALRDRLAHHGIVASLEDRRKLVAQRDPLRGGQPNQPTANQEHGFL